ncbi:TolC family protein [Dyadobacter tibetensis]|uniref:TolC family protein n=1 Tax=Dyadobacter tibetensis TaxID=1211851 RepID=UPI0004707880|nr:TolC family protein [Dyadobacter tibetensis]
MIKIILGSCLILAMPLLTKGQGVKRISLEESVGLALSHSKQLKISQANLDLAALQIRELRESQLPSLEASATYLRLNSPNVNLKLPQSGTDSSNALGNMALHQAMYGMVSTSVPIFAGFRFKYAIQSARFLERATELDILTDRESVILNVAQAYCNLYKASRAVVLVSENLKSEQERVKKFADREKNGLLARNDLMKVKLQESNIELALLDAQNELKITQVNFNLMLGLPTSTQLEVEELYFDQLPEVSPLSQWSEQALSHRKDLAANHQRQKAANSNVKVVRADMYPSVALTAGYVALGLPGLVTVPNAMNVGIGVRYNIASLWTNDSKVKKARVEEFQLRTVEGMITDQIESELTSAYYHYISSKQKIGVYEKAKQQAKENFRITNNKYDNSLVSTTELLDADVAQVQSQINYEMAKADAWFHYKKLQEAAGIINLDRSEN